MFWVISVYFNIRNTLPKSGTLLPGHYIYIYIYIERERERDFNKSSLSGYWPGHGTGWKERKTQRKWEMEVESLTKQKNLTSEEAFSRKNGKRRRKSDKRCDIGKILQIFTLMECTNK